MNNVYIMPTENNSSDPYKIVVDNFTRNKNAQWEFDAVITPPFGHSLNLKNVKYSDEKGITIPRGSGFVVNLTRRLNNKLTSIAKEISKEKKSSKKRKKETPSTKRKVPQLFDRKGTNELKNMIITGANQ